MIKAEISTIDEEFDELEKGRGPDKKKRKKKGGSGKPEKTYKGKPYKNSSIAGYIWQKDESGEPQLVRI